MAATITHHGPVQDQELVRFLRCYVERKFNLSAAARDIGRDPKTIRNHLEKNEQFREAFETTKQMVADDVFSRAYELAMAGEVQLLRDFLKAFHPEFKDRRSVELSGPGGGPVQLSDTDMAAKVAGLLAVAKRRMIEGECRDITDEDDLEDLL